MGQFFEITYLFCRFAKIISSEKGCEVLHKNICSPNKKLGFFAMYIGMH